MLLALTDTVYKIMVKAISLNYVQKNIKYITKYVYMYII